MGILQANQTSRKTVLGTWTARDMTIVLDTSIVEGTSIVQDTLTDPKMTMADLQVESLVAQRSEADSADLDTSIE